MTPPPRPIKDPLSATDALSVRVNPSGSKLCWLFPASFTSRLASHTASLVQGQFRFDQLVEWFPVVDRALLANGIHPTTGAVMEICNRIRFGLRDKSLIVDARRVVGDLGIAQEAVVFKQANPMLLALEDGREPLLRLVVDRFKRLFRSDADVDAAVERAGEELVAHNEIGKGIKSLWPEVLSTRIRIDGEQHRAVLGVAPRSTHGA